VFASHGEHVEQSTIAKISTDDEVAATPTVPVPANASTADDSLAREIALLRRARAALGQHDAQAALTLANEHADTFPSGRLRQERVAVRVLALCALGRVADARAATQELERIAPRSPHLMRIRMSCPTSDKSPAQP
jgi:ATP/maltotriose-dependent transcriptional regulator MalT